MTSAAFKGHPADCPWAEDIMEVKAALKDYINREYTSVEERDNVAVWFCLFALYQPHDGNEPTIQEQLEMHPLDAVIHSPNLKRMCLSSSLP